MLAGNKASLRLGSVDLCKCWHQGVIQAGQPRLVQGADAMLNSGINCLGNRGDQGVIEVEQAAFMQRV